MIAPPNFRRQAQAHLSDYVRALVWSPQGSTLAATSAQGELMLWLNAAQNLRSPLCLQTGGDASHDCLGFSGDGQFLAVAGQAGKLWVWQMMADGPQLMLVHPYSTVWIDRLAWHPHLPILAVGVGRQVQLWDLATQQALPPFDFQGSSVLGLAWHPAGQYLAVSGHGGVKIWDWHSPESPPICLDVPGASLGTAWSREGRYLASGNLDRTLSVLQWDSLPPWLMQGFPGKVSLVAWSDIPTESPLLAAACMEGITLWQRHKETAEWRSQVLAQHQGFVQAIAFQPQSQLLASGGTDANLILWRNAQQVGQILKGLTGGITTLAWHPSGTILAAGGQTGQVMTWSAETAGQGFG